MEGTKGNVDEAKLRWIVDNDAVRAILASCIATNSYQIIRYYKVQFCTFIFQSLHSANEFLVSFLNVPTPDDSFEHLDSSSTTMPFFLLKKPVTVLQGFSLLNQTGPVNGYTRRFRLTYYDYSPTDIEDQKPSNGQ
ncbi:hypothetical protein TNCV_4542451 [Trichonephila clavipes]|nr:hypothetical protein TNCV_4542451 [Trichonephila clavipes]